MPCLDVLLDTVLQEFTAVSQNNHPCVAYGLFIIVIQGLYWKTNVLMTAFFVPGVAFGVFFVLDLFLWGAGSSAAIPFTTLLALLCLWFAVSVPLTFLGSLAAVGSRDAVSHDHYKLILCPLGIVL